MYLLCAFSLKGGWDRFDKHSLHDYMLTCQGQQVIRSKVDRHKMKGKRPVVFLVLVTLWAQGRGQWFSERGFIPVKRMS